MNLIVDKRQVLGLHATNKNRIYDDDDDVLSQLLQKSQTQPLDYPQPPTLTPTSIYHTCTFLCKNTTTKFIKFSSKSNAKEV